eukprot:294686-Chlamydomonas_euryale.AAC.1
MSSAPQPPHSSSLPLPDDLPRAALQACLKFWDVTGGAVRNGLAVPFTLNTRVDDPHSGPVTAVAVHPAADVVATCGSDAEFRLWMRTPTQRAPGGKADTPSAWRLTARGSYKVWRCGGPARRKRLTLPRSLPPLASFPSGPGPEHLPFRTWGRAPSLQD